MIQLTKNGALWTVTIDRPDKANSLTKTMLESIAEIAENAAGQAQALVLTGTGKVFSAGADLDQARAGLATDPIWETLSGRIAAAPYLTIAALNGTLAGGAFGMALACDLRITVARAKFFYPVMKLGFLPQPSDSGRMTALIGPARTKMILLAGQKIEALEALNWGLVDRITDPNALLHTAHDLAKDALDAAPTHVAAMKSLRT